jgi:tetratricopeptide (TPR) repeat protein
MIATGSTVLHYKIGARLGEGGMGEVYLAEDSRLGRLVALKFPRADLQSDPAERARLLREARAASALRSPGIAAIYDIAEHDGTLFIVMEYAPGEPLDRKIARGPIAVGEAVDVARQVAEALDEAHQAGMVHRDIKSANLIVDDRGRVKVLDFGLARFVARLAGPGTPTVTEDTSRGGAIQGTFSYMAPEQARGGAVDHRADLFSLGVVLYEMLAGRLPFLGETLTVLVDRLLNEEPPALARFNYSVPPALDGVVRKALAKDPEFRYQSARELYIDLHAIARDMEDERRGVSPASGAEPAGPASGDGATDRPAVANAVAVFDFANVTGEAADDWIGSGIAETVTADLKSLSGITVIARAQVFDALKNLSSAGNGSLDRRIAIDVGRRLGASWVVGGAYQRLGDLIRITAEFVEIATGAVARVVKVDGRVSDLFALQDRIVYELGQGLNLRLGESEVASIAQAETRSMEAYEAYSRGLINLRMAGRDALDRAIHLLERAVGLDPSYAAAWAALGSAYDVKGSFLSMDDLQRKAVEALQRSVALDPGLSNARAWLGEAYLGLGRVEEAVAEMREAVHLDPQRAGGHAALARALWIGEARFDEAIEEFERAVSINPRGGYSYLQLGLLYAYRGDYARAEEACRQAIELQEQYISGTEGVLVIGAHARLGYVFYLQGRYDEAIREYEREMAFLSSSDHALRDRTLIELNQKLGAALLRKGDAEGAERHFKRALKSHQARVASGADDPFTRYYIACVYALQGDIDRAAQSLAQVRARLPALTAARLEIDPDLESLRARAGVDAPGLTPGVTEA